MKLVRSLLKFGGLPALETFQCEMCREVETRERADGTAVIAVTVPEIRQMLA